MAFFGKLLRLCWPWIAAIVSGLLYAGCFAPFDYDWLCWVALTPLLSAIWFSGVESKRRWARDLLLGYVAGVTFFWTVFSWLQTVTVPGWLMVGAYMAIYVALWSCLCGLLRPRLRKARAAKAPEGVDAVTRRLNEKYAAEHGLKTLGPESVFPLDSPARRSPWLSSINNLRLAFFLAAGWVTQEWLRGVVFSGWGWNTLGHALHAQIVLIQVAEFTGVAGLSFLVAFTNVILLATIRRFILETQVKPMRPHFDLTLTMAGLVGVMAFGLHAHNIRRETRPVSVALVQPNVPRDEKFTVEFENKIFDGFKRLSLPVLEAGTRPDLLVWPESSMPDAVLFENTSNRFVMDFAASARTDLMLGTLDYDPPLAYNAALLISEGGAKRQVYRKVHLVPFGEYIPGRNTIPLLARVVGEQVPYDFAFGKEYTLFNLSGDKAKIAPLICFEDTIGDLTRQFVLAGANLLVNVTNDGWFLRSAGSRQHLANAVFRCVETRLPMVRAANTGVTCFVNEFGSVTQTLADEYGSQFTDGTLVGQAAIPINAAPTFYVRYGEWFSFASITVTILILSFLLVRRVARRAV